MLFNDKNSMTYNIVFISFLPALADHEREARKQNPNAMK